MQPDNFLIPVSGAIIGYFTNWLAIKMMFRPHNEIRIFGIRLPFTPGVIPKERHRLARKMGETVSTHLLTSDALAKAVTGPETLAHIEQTIDEMFSGCENGGDAVDVLLGALFGDEAETVLLDAWQSVSRGMNGFLPRLGPLLEVGIMENPRITLEIKRITDRIVDDQLGLLAGLFVNREKLAENVKTGVVNYLNDGEHQAELAAKLDEWMREMITQKRGQALSGVTPEALDKAKAAMVKSLSFALEKGARHIASAIPIGRIVEEQVNGMSMPEGERIVISVMKRELNAITVLGGVLGFMIGTITMIMNMVK